jgi:DNA polymerase-3 subunit alpha
MLFKLSERELYSGMGTNAAGVVITSTKAEFDKLVPMAYMASRSGFVSQYAKDDIEALGLVKLDVLGSKTLTVMQRCMDNLGMDVSHLDDIEYQDAPTYRLIRSGDTTGVFQLEGRTSRWGCKDLKPSKIADVIAAMALFRPAAMGSGGTKAYINRKHGREPIPKRHELIASVTKDTWGVMLYQEQVIDILRALGMDADNLTKFLKAVKASNKNIGAAGVVIKGYQEWISEKCIEIGMSAEDQQFLDEAIAGFAEYGFNRAHATVYGITAYRCGYLAARHPVEFHAALLDVAAETKSKKEPGYVQATRKRGVKILAPNINVSGASYTVDRSLGVIRRGLLSVDGIGIKTAEVLAELAPYRSITDMVGRCPARPVSGGAKWDGEHLDTLIGVLGKLRDAGLLASLEP